MGPSRRIRFVASGQRPGVAVLHHERRFLAKTIFPGVLPQGQTLSLAAPTEEKDGHAIVGRRDDFFNAVNHVVKDLFVHERFEDAILQPVAETVQESGQPGPAAVVRNIIANYEPV
jgi:hypothetical protein